MVMQVTDQVTLMSPLLQYLLLKAKEEGILQEPRREKNEPTKTAGLQEPTREDIVEKQSVA